MANRGISMRMVREILRLYYELHLGKRQISRACGVSPSTVVEYIQKAEEKGLQWPLPVELDDAKLEAMLTATRRPPVRCLPWIIFIMSSEKRE
jgi:DNA-binding MarR family transcriptional regulator